MTHTISPQNIIDFWFSEIDSKQWWIKDAAFDELIRTRFATVHAQANRGELAHWRDAGSEGRLAEVIVLDQFSRNMGRDSPQAFASDALALILAQEAVRGGHHLALPEHMRGFVFLPFMHSESLMIHDEAVRLYTEFGDVNSLNFEMKHRLIIERFGRYPHRNAILGRVSSEQELAFLQEADSAF